MTKGAVPVSIIVLTWNGLEVTKRCLKTLMGITEHPDFEVIVVDNGSTDGTVEYLRDLEGIRLIENGENLGFVRGNNIGIRATDNDVLLLNNDTEMIQSDWLRRMQELAYSSGDIGPVGCRLVNDEGVLVHAGTYMPVPSFWGQEYPGIEKDIGQYSRDREVDGVIAACMYIKREIIERIGALDEDYFSYYEDTDYCLKAKQAGYRVFCCGGATVIHLENASTDLNRMDFSGTFRRSRDIFLSKWEDYYESLYSRRLTWKSFISDNSIYSRVSKKLLWRLDEDGVDCNLAFLEGADRAELNDFRLNDMKNRGTDRERPQVMFSPLEMVSRADGTYNIAYVLNPYDRIPEGLVSDLNRLDEVWVESDFHAESARGSGVERDISVMPLGVDPDYLNPGIKGFPLSERFTFLAPFDWGAGFAAETLLRAFTDEFGPSENVVLVVKVTSGQPGAEVEEAVEAMNLSMERAPAVFLVDHHVPEYQLGSLYRSADCTVMVQTTSGGVMQVAESLACGVPVVTTGWGSVERLVDSRVAFGIDYELVPSPVEGLQLARPDYGDLRRLLRKVFQDADAIKQSALLSSARIASELSWGRIAGRIVERLDSV